MGSLLPFGPDVIRRSVCFSVPTVFSDIRRAILIQSLHGSLDSFLPQAASRDKHPVTSPARRPIDAG